MRPSCCVGAVINLRPARRIVGRMGGVEEEKKKRRVWENNSLADPRGWECDAAIRCGGSLSQRGDCAISWHWTLECADFWCECPSQRWSAVISSKRGVFVCSLRRTRASRGATRLRMGVACNRAVQVSASPEKKVVIRLGEEEMGRRGGGVDQGWDDFPPKPPEQCDPSPSPADSLRAGFQGPGSLKKCPLPMLPCCPGGVVHDGMTDELLPFSWHLATGMAWHL